MAHGGKRSGSGRKPKVPTGLKRGTVLKAAEETIGKTAVQAITAAVVLASVDEAGLWQKHLHSEDERVSIDALKYLTDRRDGKAKQFIESKDVTERSPEERRSHLAKLLGVPVSTTQ